MKKIVRILLKTIIFICVFIFFLGINSADYLLNFWGDVSFSTVLYQLNSPLKGTSNEVIGQYIREALIPACFETILVLLAYLIYIATLKILDKLKIEFKGKILQSKIHIVCNIKRKNRKRIELLAGAFCLLIMGLTLWNKCIQIGFAEYLDDIVHASTIFEEEYVSPEEVEIEFSEKKNLLYIYMESMETTYTDVESGGGKVVDYIPNLKQLAKDNVSFSNKDEFGGLFQIAGVEWTMGALLGSTTGVPYKLPIEGNSAGEHEEFLPGIITLGEILEKEGYHNYFMCGSDISFGGRELYFRTHGNYEIIDYYTAMDEGVIPKDYYEFWGLEDCKLYEYAKEKLTKIAEAEGNFNFTMLTVDTHHPDGYICEMCDKKYPEQYANAISCADKQIVNFIDWVKVQDWYEDTVVIISGDHISMNKTFFEDLPQGYSRKIYNCFLNTTLQTESGIQNRKASIMDMFPTTLAALGAEIEGDRLGLGTNLFSERPTIMEEMGTKEFQKAVSKYSKYYNEKFIKAK